MAIAPSLASYVDPDGKEWDLGDLLLPKGYICTALTGIAGPPINFSMINRLYGGALPQSMAHVPGTIGLGLYVESLGDQTKYLNTLDDLTFAFTNLRDGDLQPGYLIIRRPGGTARRIAVYCVSGLEQNDASKDTDGIYWTTYALALTTPEPYWEDLDVQTVTYIVPPAVTGILPMLPIALGSSTILGNVTIVNDGGLEAYPTWVITGPGTPTIRNNTTGRSFTLNSPLLTGQSIQIVTKQGSQSISDLGTGTNLWTSLTINSPRDLWPLKRGANDVDLTMTGSAAGSKIVLNWTRRWLRA